MAKNEFHSPHQKGIIKRYYENIDDLSSQKLGELVSDLYLETVPLKKHLLWERARSALLHMKVDEKRVEKIIASRDVLVLAKVVEELF